MVKVCFFGSKKYVVSHFNETNKDYGYEMIFHDSNITEENASLAKGADVVCFFVNDKVSENIIVLLKNSGCKLIALRCAGFNNIDLNAAKKHELPVVRVPEYSPYAVAEHAFALILTLNRKTHKAYNRVREGNFDIVGLTGFDLHGKTIGVIGTGKIGQIFIKIAKGFGMNVLAYDLYPNKKAAEELGFSYVSLDELYQEAKIIALHCPLTEDNRYLINQESIKKMQDNVIIINTSRGGLINTKELVLEMKSGKIGAVGLDVYEEEENYFFHNLSEQAGLNDDVLARILSFNNALVTSHQAFFTEEALNNISQTTLENIRAYFEDGKILNQVIL